MAEGLARILSKQGFDPDNFVRKQAGDGEENLQETRYRVQQLQDDTAVALKRNVYKNYSQFIETAREMSILEAEMYQLSHMLSDQKSVMNTMLELSVTGDRIIGGEDTTDPLEQQQQQDRQKNLAFLLEKVEGCSSVTEVPGRYLVHMGELVELDPESFTQLQKLHVFLLNDSLMIATWLPHRRGPVKYRLQNLYELDSLAVVNMRDITACKNAFKVLMFPDTRMFQADTPKAKRVWLDILEETKKKKAAADKQRKETAGAQERISTSSFDASNPFAEEDDSESRPSSLLEADPLAPDWVQELPEDLDVSIAQRDFEGAVDMVEKVNEYLEDCSRTSAMKEYRARIDQRVKLLTDALKKELLMSAERSIRGGPRVARRAVTQLIRLGKSSQACHLFLNNRGAIIKHNMRQLKLEGATSLYLKKLCEVFFQQLRDTGQEFIKAFPKHFACFSSFVVWSEAELEEFVSLFSPQVFGSKATLSTIADCIYEARTRCDELNDLGLELRFVLEHMLQDKVEELIQQAGDNQMEAVKHRASEDMWRPVNYQNVATIHQFEDDFLDLGLDKIEDFTFDECFTALTANTIHFTKSFLTFTDDLLKLYTEDHHTLITGILQDIMSAQLKHASKSAADARFAEQKNIIRKNGDFLAKHLTPVMQEKYEHIVGQTLPMTALKTTLAVIHTRTKS